jgi:Tfp pilus assembly protein PilV
MTCTRGVSLAEVSVALVLTSLSWVAVLGLLETSVRITRRAALAEDVRWALQAVADSVDAAGGGAGRSAYPWGWISWSPEAGGTRLEGWSTDSSRVAVLWSGPGSP